LSAEILPLIDYSMSAYWYPDIMESQENLNFESNLHATSYSDFTSSVYDVPNPCEVVDKKPLYIIPSDMNFAKAYIDWLLLQQGAHRKDVRTKSGQVERTLMFRFQLSLPFLVKYMDPDFWLKTTIIIPTYYVDMETEKHMCFRFQSLLLLDYSITINVDTTNTITCDVFGYDPDVIFLDKLPNDSSLFENWISKDVRIHTYPDDIGLVSKYVVFSTDITYKSDISFVSYKDTPQLKDVWYIYIPEGNGKFKRLHGFITLSEYPLPFDTYDWILIQSQPSFEVLVEIFDPNYKLSQITATRCNVYFDSNDKCLGQIHMHVLGAEFEMFRAKISGFGKFHTKV